MESLRAHFKEFEEFLAKHSLTRKGVHIMIMGDLTLDGEWVLMNRAGQRLTPEHFLNMKAEEPLICRNTLEKADILFSRRCAVFTSKDNLLAIKLAAFHGDEEYILDKTEDIRRFLSIVNTNVDWRLFLC